ncbi:Transcriptional corepressor LEUNIG [Morella rubra]|uniref:Transcriptional corepressor LEUNIG n=1 Tax=Morella rubra TaxID=262757 RepID=A0A6A1VK09_9ROSI|nr:Transcriptional corepressor LEUNIG [Morella rubra]
MPGARKQELDFVPGLDSLCFDNIGQFFDVEEACGMRPEDMEQFGDVNALDDNVESFLSHDGGDGGNLYGTVKQSPAEHQKESSKGNRIIMFEVGCIRTRNSKVTCCHFSSDGKFLASAGDDRKVVLWNMDTLQRENTPEDHKSVITDGSPAIVCNHILPTLHLLCPSISILRRLIYSVYVITTMNYTLLEYQSSLL